jgi:hypothetical protein
VRDITYKEKERTQEEQARIIIEPERNKESAKRYRRRVLEILYLKDIEKTKFSGREPEKRKLIL